MLTPEQCRAARALVGVTAEQLAASAGISHVTLKRFESGRTMQSETIEAIIEAIQHAGVTLLADGDLVSGGRGVRLTPKPE